MVRAAALRRRALRKVPTHGEAEERFSALVQHAPDIIALFDADGVLTYASPALTRILGYEPEELVGLASPDTIHPDDFDAVVVGYEKAMAAPSAPVALEFRA
jgi:PAS domain S-box-containing protein